SGGLLLRPVANGGGCVGDLDGGERFRGEDEAGAPVAGIAEENRSSGVPPLTAAQ
ncbi:hypothetical protein SESBI_15749, partial [Sesbania bispinosa]